MEKLKMIMWTIYMNRALLKEFLVRSVIIIPAAFLYTVLIALALGIAPGSVWLFVIMAVMVVLLDLVIDYIKKL